LGEENRPGNFRYMGESFIKGGLNTDKASERNTFGTGEQKQKMSRKSESGTEILKTIVGERIADTIVNNKDRGYNPEARNNRGRGNNGRHSFNP